MTKITDKIAMFEANCRAAEPCRMTISTIAQRKCALSTCDEDECCSPVSKPPRPPLSTATPKPKKASWYDDDVTELTMSMSASMTSVDCATEEELGWEGRQVYVSGGPAHASFISAQDNILGTVEDNSANESDDDESIGVLEVFEFEDDADAAVARLKSSTASSGLCNEDSDLSHGSLLISFEDKEVLIARSKRKGPIKLEGSVPSLRDRMRAFNK